METRAVFEILLKENGEVAFNSLTSGAKKFEGQAKITHRTTNELNESFKRLTETIAGGLGVMEAFHYGQQGQEMYLGVKRAEAEIQASLKSTGSVAGETTEDLNKSFEALYHNSTYSEESIKNMQAVLLTFPAVTKNTFDQTQQTILDTATKLYGAGADLKTVTVQIGKALQDPAMGMMMLHREGVNFTKQQQEMVVAMVNSGHKLEAQKYILNELRTEFGGSAQAAFEAGGEHEKLAKTFEEVQIETGKLVDEMETDLAPTISVIVGDFKELVKWGEAHKGLILGTVKVVAALGAGYVAYTIATKAAAAADFLFGTSLAELTVGMGEATVATEAETEAMTALDAAMDANPIGLVVGALGALVGITVLAGNNTGDMTVKVTDATSKFIDMKDAVDGATTAVAQYNLQQDFNATEKRNQALVGITNKPVSDEDNAYYKDVTSESGWTAKALNRGNTNKDKKTATTGVTGGAVGVTGAAVPSPEGKDSGKQIVNTWNIKEFGKTTVNSGSVKEGADDIYDHIMRILTAAVNDSEIASAE